MPDIVGRLRAPRLASAPASPAAGESYFNTTSNVLYYWNSTSWVTSGVTGGGTPVLAASPILDVGVAGQIRAGRQLTAADFTALGLSAPAGLWNLSDLTDASGNARALSNKGAVTFASGINGAASTSAQFTGSTGQALYISDTGAADPFRIRSGSWGAWFRTAKTGTTQVVIAKATGASLAWQTYVATTNVLATVASPDGSGQNGGSGVSNVADDRWHFFVTTADGAQVRLYVDGVLEGVWGQTNAIFGAAVPFNIGANSADGSTAASSPFYGRVDEAFVTPDVLSPEQIRCLYCAKFPHGFAGTPTVVTLAVRRQRKGAPFATTDFPTQPLRLHNLTGGALTDLGSNNVTLTNNNAAVAVAGSAGLQLGAFNFVAASSQSLSSTDAGLPSGTAARSYGCWFKTTSATAAGLCSWGTISSGDARLVVNSPTAGSVAAFSAADSVVSGYVTDGQWHFAVVVEDNAAADGVKRKFYVDGVLAGGSTVLNAITLAGANRFRVGSNSDGTAPLTGQVDGAFVCGYALTQDQVSTLWAKGSQALAPSAKNAGDHVEYMDATSIYAVFDTLPTQHQIDLAITG